MAEAPSLSMAGERLEKLDHEITCTLCSRHYEDPRVLPCCHYYCIGCLRSLQSPEQTITCPDCKASITITACGDETLEGLPSALVVNHLKQIHSNMAKLTGEEGLQCDMCPAPKAAAFCRECEEFLCPDCLSCHQKMKVKFQGHCVFSLEDLKSEAVAFPSKHLPKLCLEHKEPFKLYCFDCCRLICRDCTVIEHSQHHYEFVTKSITSTRSALDASLTPLNKLLSDFTEADKFIAEAKDRVTSQGLFVARHIHEQFTAMIDLLKKRELELLKKTELVVKKKMSRLDQQDKELQGAISAMVTVANFVSSHFDVVSDEELLTIQHDLYTRIDRAVRRYEGLKLTPTEAANLAVKISMEGDLSKICRDKAQVYLFPQHKKSHVHFAEMNKETVQLVMDPKPENDFPVSLVSAKLASEVDGTVVEAAIFRGGKGLYEITYMPRVRGHHKLSVLVNEKPISNSPFLVFVTISPELLGPEPLRIITGLKQPYAAIFDKDQNLLVTESSGTKVCSLLRDAEGKISNKIGHFVDLKNSNPSGIAGDDHGNIYITSASGYTIARYNKEGTLLALRDIQGEKPGQLTHPCGVGIIKNEVYVCDRNNSQIQVYSKDLVPVRVFGEYGKEPGQLHWPYDLTQDEKGHVYITDCNNHRIQVFDKNGKFLRMFGSKGSKERELKRPMGVSLAKDGQHIFVTEYDNHRVSVYTLDGNYVTSLGHYGTNSGELCYPVGLAFDSDGFLYVCDQGNNRIQVF